MKRRPRVYVPPRASRTEGDFPILSSHRQSRILDVSDIEDSSTSLSSHSRIKPHLLSKKDKSSSMSGSGFKPSSSTDPFQEMPEIRSFENDSVAPELKERKIRWLPNPFLPNNDLRQGGPLYYAKHFTDRQRISDEKIVREGLESVRDGEDIPDEKRERGRRCRAFWRQYRPLPVPAIHSIQSLDKLARIFANEVHLANKSSRSAEPSSSITAIEDRFTELLQDVVKNPMSKDTLIPMIKCMHFLGVYGKVSDFQTLNVIMDVLASPSSRKFLKPVNYIYALQAMSRLTYRDHRLIKLVDFLALSWGIVGVKEPLMLIRGANALGKLDLISATPFTMNLKEAIGDLIPKLTVPGHLEKIKAITIIALFDELMILDYLVMCFEKKISYKRHMILVYLYHRNNESVMNKIPSHVKEWIEETVRESCALSEQGLSATTSSSLHQDIEKIIRQKFSHHEITSGQKFGPLTLDIFIPSLNMAIEACSEFQFYHRTSKLTAEARLRHELIRSFGIKLVPVYHFNWTSLSEERKYHKLKADLSSQQT